MTNKNIVNLFKQYVNVVVVVILKRPLLGNQFNMLNKEDGVLVRKQWKYTFFYDEYTIFLPNLLILTYKYF